MTFGEDWGWGAAKDEAGKVYGASREAGGNVIDTTPIARSVRPDLDKPAAVVRPSSGI